MSDLVLVIGSGGHASVLLDILLYQKQSIAGFVSPDLPRNKSLFGGLVQYLKDDDVLAFSRDSIQLVNGIGSLPNYTLRQQIYRRFSERGYLFKTVISPNSIVSPFAKLSEGVQVMAGAVIQGGVTIGENTIVNTGAIIDHDCIIGPDNHIAPGVTLSGEVRTGREVHIGTGANVIQGVEIGENSVVGSGAVVTKEIAPGVTVYPWRSN